MVEYPFNEELDYVDREAFNALSPHFVLSKDFAEYRGLHIFEWGNGWDKLNSLPTIELCKIAPFILGLEYAFNNGETEKENRFSQREFIKLLKKRGVSREDYLRDYLETEIRALGPESAQVIGGIAEKLDETEWAYEKIRDLFELGRSRYHKYKNPLEKLNQERKAPYSLEKILSFDHEPVCLCHSEDGRLYVLDDQVTLHEFTEEKKTNEWKLWQKWSLPDMYTINLSQNFQSFPCIAVEGEHALLVNNSIYHYNLTDHQLWEGKVAIASSCDPNGLNKGANPVLPQRYTGHSFDSAYDERGRLAFHDVVMNDGNIFVSISDEEDAFRKGRRGYDPRISMYLVHGGLDGPNLKFKLIYEGDFPVNNSKSNVEDNTLRLGFHKGHLYFPRGKGISVFNPQGSPIEMLAKYKEKEDYLGPMNPTSKFALGRDFMVAQATMPEFNLPMFYTFREIKENNGEHLVPEGKKLLPPKLRFEHVGYHPKMTGKTLTNASISAYDDQFAITSSFFKQVRIYRMGDFQKVSSG